MTFDSHVLTLVDVAARLVNGLTPGERGGAAMPPLLESERVAAVATALGGDGRRSPRVSVSEARALVETAARLREVFERVDDGDERAAVRALNALMATAGARPQLDARGDGGWQVHFHGSDDGLATGWAAGCATGLALAIGSDLAGRLGICAAERCDRVFVDTSRNGTRRFCSTSCQSRTKAAAFRARR